MKKENHDFEIRASRALGFGGSDAAMVLAIGKKLSENQPLTTTMKRRLRVIAGIDPIPEAFTTENTERGHMFEDEVANRYQSYPEIIREYKMENVMEFNHFKVFAHADFFDTKTETVIECKWTRTMNYEELKERYMAQLQWYYMLGAKSVRLIGCVENISNEETITSEDSIVGALVWSLNAIDECWESIDLSITEASGSELPPSVLSAIKECHDCKIEIAKLQKRYDDAVAVMLEWMSSNGMSKISSDYATVTYTPAGSSSRFDSVGLKKAYPTIWEMFNKKSDKKEYITLKIKENDN